MSTEHVSINTDPPRPGEQCVGGIPSQRCVDAAMMAESTTQIGG
jgi:hypothetical protein